VKLSRALTISLLVTLGLTLLLSMVVGGKAFGLFLLLPLGLLFRGSSQTGPEPSESSNDDPIEPR